MLNHINMSNFKKQGRGLDSFENYLLLEVISLNSLELPRLLQTPSQSLKPHFGVPNSYLLPLSTLY